MDELDILYCTLHTYEYTFVIYDGATEIARPDNAAPDLTKVLVHG